MLLRQLRQQASSLSGHLSLFWPVLDVIGDILFLLTELLSADTATALEEGPIPYLALVVVASTRLLLSFAVRPLRP